MTRPDTYVSLKREKISLSALDAEERSLVNELIELQKRESNWPAFRNNWMSRVAELYEKRGLHRREIICQPVWKIAQDLGSRIMVRTGLARAPDYRDKLDEIIRAEFPNRRAFCEATGISEDMLSHVIAHRKHLAVDTLTDALERIGYELRIAPISNSES